MLLLHFRYCNNANSRVHPTQITSTANDITSTNNVLTVVFRSDKFDRTTSRLVFSASYHSILPPIGKKYMMILNGLN